MKHADVTFATPEVSATATASADACQAQSSSRKRHEQGQQQVKTSEVLHSCQHAEHLLRRTRPARSSASTGFARGLAPKQASKMKAPHAFMAKKRAVLRNPFNIGDK
eukprot:252120-Amphidinium_carterae.1